MKNFLYKLKQDFRQIFSYPDVSLKDHPVVNYDYYWQKRGRKGHAILSEWQKERADIVIARIPMGGSILDIGCGDGALLKYIMDKKELVGIGVDMDKATLDVAKGLGINTYYLDLRDTNAIEALPDVDYVIGFEILEHIPEPETIVRALSNKAKKGMFFSFPNTGYYTHRLRLLFGKFPLQWIAHPAEHVRYWTVKDAVWWIRSQGFKLRELIIYQGLPILKILIPSIFGQGIMLWIDLENRNE